MADKLFYSYNATWINNNSIQYTEKYSYALIINPKNHILAYNGKDYGVFHNENFISCIPQSNFINQNNVITGSSNQTYLFIKVPSDSLTLGNDNTNTNRKNISFDISINNGTIPIKYTVSGSLATGNNTLHIWKDVEVLKVSNTDTNFPINFGYFRYSTSPYTYLPYIAFGPLNSFSPITTVNIHNINSSSNFDSSTNNFIDNNNNNKLYKWEICLLSSPLGNTYYLSTNGRISTSDTSLILPNGKIQQHNIWGKPFNGTNDVYGTLTLNSNNKWYKQDESSESSSYVLKTDKINVNCDDTGNHLAVAGTAVITSTTYIASGDGNAYIGVLNNTTDARLNNGSLQAKLYVNGISYTSKLNINSKDTSLNYACRIEGKNSSSTGGNSSQYSIYATNGWNYLAGNTGIKHIPNTNYKLYIQGDNADEFGGSSNEYSTYITHGWNFLAGNTGIGVNPNTNYKLHIKGSSSTSTDGDSSHYALYTDYGWNYLASNTGIGITPNTNYKLYVSGKTYLTGNVGIGIEPDTGSTYRLKVDGSSSYLSTLFSNGKIIFNDEYTFIQKTHVAGLQPHYDISNGGSNGILNMYISNSATTLWHSNYTNSNLGIHKIFSAQAHIHSDYCGLWNMGIWNYNHYDTYGQNVLQQTKAGTVYGSVYNTTLESRRNSQLGGLNMILFYHTVKNNLGELITNINYVFRSAYRNRILFYGAYTDQYGTWHYQSATGTYSNAGVKGNDSSVTMDSDYFNNNNTMKAYYGDFGGFVSCIEGNVYNIVVLGVVNLYKDIGDYSWRFNNSNLRALPTDTSLVTSSGLLIYGCWFDTFIGDTNTRDGFSNVVAGRYNSIRFRCRVNPDLTWKRHIHVSNTITELHTNWGASSDSIVGPTAVDNGNQYENHSGVMRNDDTEVHIYMYGPNINDTGSLSFRTISITILGWLYDGDN